MNRLQLYFYFYIFSVEDIEVKRDDKYSKTTAIERYSVWFVPLIWLKRFQIIPYTQCERTKNREKITIHHSAFSFDVEYYSQSVMRSLEFFIIIGLPIHG